MEEKCKFCGGSGWLPLKEHEKVRKCKCTTLNSYRKKLGRDIVDAPILKDSPYLKLINRDVFITSNRKEFLPHLRFALISQGMNFFSRVTNDSQMLNAWLSKEKGVTQDETGARDYTSLPDLVEDPELLIVFLAVVSYPNRALPGVLGEAIRIRAYQNRATWIINPHSYPYSSGHLCWSAETAEYIKENFLHRKIDPDPNWKPMRTLEELDEETMEGGNTSDLRIDGMAGKYK